MEAIVGGVIGGVVLLLLLLVIVVVAVCLTQKKKSSKYKAMSTVGTYTLIAHRKHVPDTILI